MGSCYSSLQRLRHLLLDAMSATRSHSSEWRKGEVRSQAHRPLPRWCQPHTHPLFLGTGVWRSLNLVANREMVALLFCGLS